MSLRRDAPPRVRLPFQHRSPASGSAAASVALPFTQGRFSGRDGALQPDGTVRCPAGQALCATDERWEAYGSLRLVDAARINHCRGCQFREQSQWHGSNTQKSHRVSVLLHPLQVGFAPFLWKDWSRRQHRRACLQLVRHQRVDVHLEPAQQPGPTTSPPVLSRAQRAHSRRSWEQRLASNALASMTARCTITLFGALEGFATWLGLFTASHHHRSSLEILFLGKASFSEHIFLSSLLSMFSVSLTFRSCGFIPPLCCFPLLDILSCPEELSPPSPAMSSSTGSLRNSGAYGHRQDRIQR